MDDRRVEYHALPLGWKTTVALTVAAFALWRWGWAGVGAVFYLGMILNDLA